MTSELRKSDDSRKIDNDRNYAEDISKAENEGDSNGGSENEKTRRGDSVDPVEAQAQRDTRKSQDPNLVTWDGPDDPENPKNWSNRKKWNVTVILSLFAFLCPMVSAMIAPALDQEAKDLHITNNILIYMSLSIFVLAWAIGPFFLGPLSEVHGRVRVLQFSNFWFLAWNIGCTFARNTPEILVFRFFAGLGASAQLGVGGGMLSDCWRPEQRGKAVGMYGLAPNVGAAIGPLLAGWVVEKSSWRWLYGSTSIADVLLQAVGLYLLKESHAPTILRKRAKKLSQETGNEKLYAEDANKSFLQLLPSAIKRPFIMISTQPIVQTFALYQAYLFGMFYLFLSTFGTLYIDVYHQSRGIASLHYIALALGFGIGGQVNTHLADGIYRRLKARYGGVNRPEFRLPMMMPASCLVPIGLFWYAWSAQAHIHWIMPDIGAFIFGVGGTICFQGTQAYIIDAYQRYAASAMAAIVMLRSLAGFSFPLFAPYMIKALDYGWSMTILAFVSIFIGIPAPISLWFYGQRLRKLSQYAAG